MNSPRDTMSNRPYNLRGQSNKNCVDAMNIHEVPTRSSRQKKSIIIHLTTITYSTDPMDKNAQILIFQRLHINDKAIFDVAFEHTFIGAVDILHFNQFHISNDMMHPTKVKHLLSFGDSANNRASY
jgi:hypothetical protein